MRLIVALSLLATASAESVDLTPDNFDEVTAGKLVFIKYYAPWCGFCQAIAEDWEKLASDWDNDPIVIVGEVDCDNGDNKPLCDGADVKGYPTLKWGDSSELQDYSGDFDYESFSTFAAAHLKPMCSLSRLDLCSEEKKASITKFQDMSVDELVEMIRATNDAVLDTENEMDEKLDDIQDLYEAKIKEMKRDAHYALVSTILKSKGGTMPSDDDDYEGDIDDNEDDNDSGDDGDEEASCQA